jgi:hypothetical protein
MKSAERDLSAASRCHVASIDELNMQASVDLEHGTADADDHAHRRILVALGQVFRERLADRGHDDGYRVAMNRASVVTREREVVAHHIRETRDSSARDQMVALADHLRAFAADGAVFVTRCDLAIRADDHAVFRLETDDACHALSFGTRIKYLPTRRSTLPSSPNTSFARRWRSSEHALQYDSFALTPGFGVHSR